MNKKTMDMIACDIINVINKTKQQIEEENNKLTQLRKFYTENKDKLDYELVKTFFDKTFISHYKHKHNCDYPTGVGFIAQQKEKENLKIFCDEEKIKLIFKIGLLKHKLKYYENLIWQNKFTLIISWLYTCVIFLIMVVLSVFATILSILILNSIIYQFLYTAVAMSRVQCD